MSEVLIDWEALQVMEPRRRAQLVNALSGPKPANVIGTQDEEGCANLAIITSVVHLGSDPALLGHVMRPPVPRERGSQSYHNLKATGQYTLNHVQIGWHEAAHQTSARYADGESEFEAVGLTPTHRCGFEAPAVAEAAVRVGLEFVEELALPNGCRFIVGAIRWATFPEKAWAADGALDLAHLGAVAVTGLDGYHGLVPVARLSYAKPHIPLTRSTNFLQPPSA